MINDLGELKKLLKILRATGVTEIEFDNVKMKLGDVPRGTPEDAKEAETDTELSEDQLAFYSVGSL